MKAIIYEARPQAKRIKVHVPYAAVEWRKNIKALDSSFYHQEQNSGARLIPLITWNVF